MKKETLVALRMDLRPQEKLLCSYTAIFFTFSIEKTFQIFHTFNVVYAKKKEGKETSWILFLTLIILHNSTIDLFVAKTITFF